MKLEIILKPNSKNQNIEKLTERAYKIEVKAPARNGLANKEMIGQLSTYFNIPQKQITIIVGHKSRRKLVNLEL